MRKDFKTGVFLGLVLATAAVVWLSTRQCLSIKSRMLGPGNSISAGKSADENDSPKNPPNILPGLTTLTSETPQLESSAAAGGEQKIHIVQAGETLRSIAKKYYSSADKWYKILEANHPLIKDANKLTQGTKLIIPP